MSRSLLSAAAALLLLTPALSAQSLLSTRGLGIPVAPVDARARILGGIGVGLFGPSSSLLDPAAAAGSARRSVVAALQPVSRTVEFEGRSDAVSSNRFPLIHVTYPMGRVVPHLGLGAFMDQSWAIATESTETVGDGELRVRDLLEARGGIAQLRLGAAVPITPSLAVGASVGRYTGSLERIVSRAFPDVPAEEMRGFESRSLWSYGAPLAALGVRWDPATVVRLAGSFTWSGRLSADGDDAEAPDFSVDLPMQFAAGASALLSPELSATVGGRWAGWSRAAADLEGGAVDSWQIGGGLEWLGATVAERLMPIRAGGSFARLPFPFQGEAPTEWSLGLGAGLRLAADEVGPLAVLDAALERGGTRASAEPSVSERFWRFTLSVNLFGR